MFNKPREITGKQLEADIEEWGIPKGSNIVFHSSMKSLGGHVEGGPDSIIDAMIEAWGRDSNIMVPTFTYSLEIWPDCCPFDRESSPSRNGIISETFRHRPDAVRNNHPTHAVAAIGPQKEELIFQEDDSSPLGYGCPFHRLMNWGGWIVMIGCDHTSNSFVHTCEILANVPYKNVGFNEKGPDKAVRVNKTGEIERVDIIETPGCSQGFNSITPFLNGTGSVKKGRLGMAEILIMKAEKVAEIVVPALQRHPDLLLCDNFPHHICQKRSIAIG
jgi:aminoglycoside 3-N-acetyltransferase